MNIMKRVNYMRKKFKSKKESKNIIKTFIIIVLLVICYFLLSNIISKINLNINNNDLIYYALKDTNSYLCDKNKKDNILLKTIYKIDFKNPATLLHDSTYYINIEQEKTELVYNQNYEQDIQVSTTKDKPLVYIYSTHPTETFKNDELTVHNIEPNIKEVSFVLKEKLEENNVNVIVEEASIPDYLKEHNYDYNQSYTASLYYLKKAYQEHPGIDLIIDLHRDGVDYQYSVASINDKKYARIMFVVGLNRNNYQTSIDISNKMITYLNKHYQGISRGLFTNKSAGFNQFFNDNMILIELGGNNNQLIEVLNSVDVLAETIKEYLYENRG